ncbi:ABC-three component system middle component 2 [Phytohabitans flavus]|uniref:ABC-three component system middle component 2 n=1 Tax=Phytohabitans flavus TaxID=1076124 RepID=UPI00362BD3C4
MDADRVALFDFLAANPLLLAREESDPDRTRLRLAGFDDRALSYSSVVQRYVTRRQRIPDDLAWLITYGLVTVVVDGRVRHRLTPTGQHVARSFMSMYARAYREAAVMVVNRLGRMPDRGLAEVMSQWMTARAQPRSLDFPRIGR